MSLAAGFDCGKAVTPTEKSICADGRLSDLDCLLLEAYKKALANAPDPDAVKAEQRSWLNSGRNTCQTDVACLTQAYNDRLAQLNPTAPLPVSAHPEKNKAKPDAAGTKPKATFGDVELFVKKSNQNEIYTYYSVQLKRSKKTIFEDESTEPVQKITNDNPKNGCRTMTVGLHSGGNHCCTAVLLCAECDGKSTVDELDLGEGAATGFKDVARNGVKALEIYDCAFNEYGLDVPGQRYWGMPHVSTKCMARYLIFDNGQWRLDRPGEFRELYDDLGRKARSETQKSISAVQRAKARRDDAELEECSVVAGLIQTAYYSLMAMNLEKDCFEALRKSLPADLQPVSRKLFGDIKKAVAEFNPLKHLE